jgi:hypothetical protein
MIRFSCPHCGCKIEVRKELAGKAGNCKTCNQKIRVPDREGSGGHLFDLAGFPQQEPAPARRPVVRRSRRTAWIVLGVAMVLGISGFLLTPFSPIDLNPSAKKRLVGTWEGVWKDPSSRKETSSALVFEKDGRGSMTLWTEDTPRGIRSALKYRWLTDSQIEMELLDESNASGAVKLTVSFPDKTSLVLTNDSTADVLQFKRAKK